MKEPSKEAIAREAAVKIETDWKTATVNSTTAIILAAIERATHEDHGALKAWNESDARNLPEKIGPSPYPPDPQPPATEFYDPKKHGHDEGGYWCPPPATDAQEWTIDGDFIRSGNNLLTSLKAIADAHNAALAAVRPWAVRELEIVKRDLAAERQKADKIAENARNLHVENVRLSKELLTAQAAIAEHNKATHYRCLDIDKPSLALLEAHDAEVRAEAVKPLVKVLWEAREHLARSAPTSLSYTPKEHAALMDKIDALAKVKEGK